MADGIQKYSESANVAKYKAGIQGSDFMGEPNPPPAMTVVEGYPPEVTEKLQGQPIPTEKPFDPWVYRRPNGKM